MNIFDTLYFSLQKNYKPKYRQKANLLALWYVSFLQYGLLLLIGVLIAHFLKGMRTAGLDEVKAWLLYSMVCIFIAFKNWMGYSGRKRKVMIAKGRKKSTGDYNTWMLWMLLIGVFALALLLLMQL